ncbi:MAG: tetratricopeptide repeat protein [Armatimonadota bacterium]
MSSKYETRARKPGLMPISSVVIVAVLAFGFGLYIGHGMSPKSPAFDIASTSEMPTGDMPVVNAQTGLSDDQILREINGMNNFTMLVGVGNQMFDAERPMMAIAAYEKALKIDPNSADIRTDLGTMYLAVGRADDAIAQFREAIRIDPKHENSRYNLGVAYLQGKHDSKGAIKAWDDYLQTFPNSGNAAKVQRQVLELISDSPSR